MQDKLIIVVKVKKTFDYVSKVVVNYPHKELVLKNRILDSFYDLLELVYKANIYKDVNYMKEILVCIRMIEFYIKSSLDKGLISYKKFSNIGSYLLEINKMVNSWILHEKTR